MLTSLATGTAAALVMAGLTLVGGPAAAAPNPCGTIAERPWCDVSASPDTRAGLLLTRLTLDEKIGLMSGEEAFTDATDIETDAGHAAYTAGIPRLGVPGLRFVDGPAGLRQGAATALPAPIALGATFDPAAARRFGALIGDEARHKANEVLLGPAVDVDRTPLSGRTFESFGEDPALTSALAGPWVQGAQAQGVISTVKHFAAYTQETHRFTHDAVVSERVLREIYLPAHEAAVDAGAGMVMCAYPRVDGEYACENDHLLTEVLRDDWGFRGAVISDFLLGARTPDGAANAGLDLELPTPLVFTVPKLRLALLQNQVTRATIDARVRATLRTMFAFGVFDRKAYVLDAAGIDRAAHDTTARQLEEGAVTLLQNDGVLPLTAPRRIAVIGSAADELVRGGGSSQVKPTSTVTVRQGITARAGDSAVVYDPGASLVKAAATARGADVAVVVVRDRTTEFVDKPCLALRCGQPPGTDQDALVTAVAAANPNTVVVLQTGSSVLTPWRGKVRAVLEAWYPGQQGGTALARVLFGDVDPGGRLPLTFPARETDTPTSGDPKRYPGVDGKVVFSEGVDVGYRHYDAAGLVPAYPFGHGLSYTTFGYSHLSVTPGGVTATVTNTGRRTGTAVPQLYVGLPAPNAATPQPPRQLKGFTKLSLAPGASARVTFPLTDRALSYWSPTGWKVAPGRYTVQVGASSRDLPLNGAFTRR